MSKRKSAKIDKDLHQRFKMLAVERKVKLETLIDDALAAYLFMRAKGKPIKKR